MEWLCRSTFHFEQRFGLMKSVCKICANGVKAIHLKAS